MSDSEAQIFISEKEYDRVKHLNKALEYDRNVTIIIKHRDYAKLRKI